MNILGIKECVFSDAKFAVGFAKCVVDFCVICNLSCAGAAEGSEGVVEGVGCK
jgi:hypothetical protein